MEYDVHGEDCAMLEQTESEKYYTIPRSGEASSAYKTAFQPRRPASTAGIPMSVGASNIGGVGIARRSSVNAGGQKPPPPVRRTSSVTGSTPAHVQKLRNSPPRQVSVDTAMANQQLYYQQQQQHLYQGGVQMEPLYAELNQGNGGVYRMQPSHTYAAQGVSEVDGSSHQSAVNVIQSLNAKFASLNSQYQEGNGFEPTAGSVPAPSQTSPSKPPPPAVMQKPNKSGIPLPPSLVAAQKQQLRASQGGQHQRQQQHGLKHHPVHVPHHKQIHQGQNQHHHHHQHQQGRVPDQQRHSHLPQHYHQQLKQGHHQMHHPHNEHGADQSALGANNVSQLQQQPHHHSQQPHSHLPPVLNHADDFPLPPTEEELQEIERIYSVPPPMGPSVRGPPQPPVVQKQQQQQQNQQQHPQHQPQNVQASLLMELKRRVSVDDTSHA
ncbi:metastasis suppressor protein 1 [Elysia marginata]|uniref:Metastasis suppressor protein 1 n=1 Tax=Elysia marginata TaxID=1093978 RepID=A0AAV4GAC5_9GAST|nr:metastasis suppressor protein 1 [Elysia marginata]